MLTYEVERGTEALRKALYEMVDIIEGKSGWALCHQLAWSGNMMAKAAQLQEDSALLERLQSEDNPRTLRELWNWYVEQVGRDASEPESSTGPMHNMMDRLELAARAKVAARLGYYLDSSEADEVQP
jgi:hypothetical protein